MKKFLFVDLDDTLFQTSGKCLNESNLHPAAYLSDGSACSFTTPRQRAFFESMQREMTLIPTTARNRDAFYRVDLPFSSYSILNYGGIVLEPGGVLDTHWLTQIQTDMAHALTGLHEVMEVMDAYAARRGWASRSRLIEDYETPFYVVIKDAEKNADNLEPIEREAVVPWITDNARDFFIHRNGNNLAVLPNTLGKARAVEYVRKRLIAEHGAIMTLGMGDSKSDARFMATCDYAIIPTGTQLGRMAL